MHSHRCLGVAVEAGLSLLSAVFSQRQSGAASPYQPRRLPRGSRLVLFTAGPCNFGPGAISQAALEAGAGYHERLSGSLSREHRQQASAAQEFVTGRVDLARSMAVPIDVFIGRREHGGVHEINALLYLMQPVLVRLPSHNTQWSSESNVCSRAYLQAGSRL